MPGSTGLASWGVPARLYPPASASVQPCTGQPRPGHEYYEPGMTRGVYVGDNILHSTAGYLVRYRYGQAPGHAVPGSTHFAFREAPARLTSCNPSLGREHYEPMLYWVLLAFLSFREAPARLTSHNPSLGREHYEPMLYWVLLAFLSGRRQPG